MEKFLIVLTNLERSYWSIVVVGSAIIDKINKSYQKDKNNIKLIANSARDFVQSLSTALNNVKE